MQGIHQNPGICLSGLRDNLGLHLVAVAADDHDQRVRLVARPSAGITMATALASAFTNTPLRHDIAMTGEVTLRGRVLQIGGLKEKILAAKRVGIYTVILPERNQKDLADIPKHLLKGMTFVFADTMEEVLRAALRRTQPHKSRVKLVKISKPAKPLKRAPARRPVAAVAGTPR